MKKATEEPWMEAPVYGQSLTGLTLNLLVRDVAATVAFAEQVLEARTVFSSPDIAVFAHKVGAGWMVHADHTYLDHVLAGSLASGEIRGLGAEIRLHGLDPDAAEARARAGGYTVLDGTADKPHGLREVYLLDPDGYLFVPDVPVKEG